MNLKHRILLTCALLASVATAMALRPVNSYAVGDVHVILVKSLPDRSLQDMGELKCFLPIFSDPESIGAFGTSPSLETKFDGPLMPLSVTRNWATYRILEGEDADPYNIARVCREVSQKAGPDDAIMVMVQSRAEMVPDGAGNDRHVLFPMATSNKPDDRGVGIPRGTILKNLNASPHRLVALLTETYEGPTTFVEPEPGEGVPITPETIRAPLPKDTPYLVKFLQTAQGELNIGWRWQSPVALTSRPEGMADFSPFSFILSTIATNGLYLETELNPDDFYRLLKIQDAFNKAIEANFNPKNWDLWSRHPRDIDLFAGNQLSDRSWSAPFTTTQEAKRFFAERREKLIDSGEFEVDEISPFGTPVPADGDDSDYKSPDDDSDDDFVPAPKSGY
ncbi:MAG: hypothetical protein IJL92_02515 [Thermoguttaceae bacterium]|nr:hypothetical protein [Thermoguttaceae bacterium]